MGKRCITTAYSQLWIGACPGLRTGCIGQQSQEQAASGILELIGTACVHLARDWMGWGRGMERLRGLACTGFWDGELGCTRSTVSADPAKKIPEPSGPFDGSCPRIINNVGPLWVLFLFYRWRKWDADKNEAVCLQLQSSPGQSSG